MTDTQTIVGEIPDPRPGYLACPHCGNDELSAREFLAINHKDPDRSIVSLSFRPDKSFIDVSAPALDGIASTAELHIRPTTQGIMIKCECDKCSAFAIYYEVRFEPDGRTRFYWCHSVRPQREREEAAGFTFATSFEVGSTTRRDPNLVLLTLYGDIDGVLGAEIAKVAIPLDRVAQLTAALNAGDSASSSPVTNDPPSAAR